nr:unnamed protein product [Callosobruchus analis]
MRLMSLCVMLIESSDNKTELHLFSDNCWGQNKNHTAKKVNLRSIVTTSGTIYSDSITKERITTIDLFGQEWCHCCECRLTCPCEDCMRQELAKDILSDRRAGELYGYFQDGYQAALNEIEDDTPGVYCWETLEDSDTSSVGSEDQFDPKHLEALFDGLEDFVFINHEPGNRDNPRSASPRGNSREPEQPHQQLGAVIEQPCECSVFDQSIVPISSRSSERSGFTIEEAVDDNTVPLQPTGQKQNGSETDAEGKSVFLSEVLRVNKRARILHDIVPNRSQRLTSQTIRKLLGGCRPSEQGLHILADHGGDHIHAIHDCRYYNQRCRCDFYVNLRGGERCLRRIAWAEEFSTEDWGYLAVYLQKAGRSIIYCKIAGREWVQCGQFRHLPIRRGVPSGQESVVEEGEVADHIRNFVACRSITDSSGPIVGRCGASNVQNSRSKERSKTDELLEWLREHATSPIKAILSTRLWLDSKWKFVDPQKYWVRVICDKFNKNFVLKSTQEIGTYFGDVKPLYRAPNGMMNDYYYSIDESVAVINELLMYQFNQDRVAVRQFLKDRYNICNKLLPKKNALLIVSPPNAGKNYFLEFVANYYISVGIIGNFNKYNQFPLMEAYNKRILFWDEPVAEPSAFETLEVLFAGTRMPVFFGPPYLWPVTKIYFHEMMRSELV